MATARGTGADISHRYIADVCVVDRLNTSTTASYVTRRTERFGAVSEQCTIQVTAGLLCRL